MTKVHVVGAGLAGLASAVELSRMGCQVGVYEMAGAAGGRCRSFFDDALGCDIDNGNHLLMSANSAVRTYIEAIGAAHGFWSPPEAIFPFLDLATGERWTVAPNRGRLPWWILAPNRRVAGTRPWHYLGAYKLPFAGPNRTVGECLNKSNPLFERFWEPLTVAALNTAPDDGAAALLWRVLAETFVKGAEGCVPMIARNGLGPALVTPALDTLERAGIQVHFNTRLRNTELADGRAAKLAFSGGDGLASEITLDKADRIVLAVPPLAASGLLPDLTVPDQSRAIVNAHFKVSRKMAADGEVGFLGLIGGAADWLFCRGDVVSVTVSAADILAQRDNREIERILWRDTACAFDLKDEDLIAARIINEKRATFAQTPAQNALRPGPVTRWDNLFLAGDWTDTGLPATIEGTVRSAQAAVAALTAAA